MERIKLISIIYLFLIGCELERHPESEVQMMKNGVFTRNGEPYTGISYAADSSYEDEYNNGAVVRSTYFHDNDQKRREGIHNGDRTEETWWYTNGEIHLKQNWISDSLRHGNAYIRLYNGQSWIESNWKNGKKHGKFTKWYASGQVHYEKEFEHGKPTGEWTYWLGNGDVLSKTEFTNGTPITTYVKLENADSVVITYFENGGLDSYTSYQEGIENGLYMEFWESNQRLRAKGMMKSGQRDGEWTRWSEFGCNLMSPNFETEWHKNRVTNHGIYILGKKEGVWTMFMDSNNPTRKWIETTYKDGKRHGKFTMWGGEGKVVKEEMYSDGVLVSDSGAVE